MSAHSRDIDNDDTPELLRMVGWVPADSPLGPAAIASIQRHMIRVILGSTVDFHQRRRRDFEPEVDDDNGDDGHDNDMQQPDESGIPNEPAVAIGMRQRPNDMQQAPVGNIPRQQEGGPGGHGVLVPPSPPRLRHREIPDQLPDHIRTDPRTARLPKGSPGMSQMRRHRRPPPSQTVSPEARFLWGWCWRCVSGVCAVDGFRGTASERCWNGDSGSSSQ